MNGAVDRARSGQTPDADAGMVLIAEDDAVSRVVARAMLAKRGYRTALARNGREAVDMALAGRHAAVLMDCEMPELDGFQATRAIRAAERGAHLPIIAMTAFSSSATREQCLSAGMDDYLLKPIRPDHLDAVIKKWLGSATRSPADYAVRGDDSLDQGVAAQLRELLSAETRVSLIDTFEKSVARCLEDIESAFDRGDRCEVARVAHLLKGSATTLGVARLRRACEALERAARDMGHPLERHGIDAMRGVALESPTVVRGRLL